MTQDRQALHAVVSGRVQGVGFRAFTRNRALRLGLAGFVRNLPDGRVEVLAGGPGAALQGLVYDLRSGPAGSLVRGVEFDWPASLPHFGAFTIETQG